MQRSEENQPCALEKRIVRLCAQSACTSIMQKQAPPNTHQPTAGQVRVSWGTCRIALEIEREYASTSLLPEPVGSRASHGRASSREASALRWASAPCGRRTACPARCPATRIRRAARWHLGSHGVKKPRRKEVQKGTGRSSVNVEIWMTLNRAYLAIIQIL